MPDDGKCAALLISCGINNSGANQKKQDIPYHLAVSNQDLKQFSKSDLLGFAGAVFMDFCPEGDLHTSLLSKRNI